MGFFDKLKKKKEQHDVSPTGQFQLQEPDADTFGSILFDKADLDTKKFEETIVENFGRESLVQVDDSHPSVTHFVVRLEGVEFWCSYMPFPLPKEEGDIALLLHVNLFISAEEQKALADQKSFMLIAQKGGGKTLQEKMAVCLLYSQLCGAIMQVEGAAGFLLNKSGLLVGRGMYLKQTDIIKQSKDDPRFFPVALWILVYPAAANNGTPTIETRGLEQFGFMELLFYAPKKEPPQYIEILYVMARQQITGERVYSNMDMISFSEDHTSILKQGDGKLSIIGDI